MSVTSVGNVYNDGLIFALFILLSGGGICVYIHVKAKGKKGGTLGDEEFPPELPVVVCILTSAAAVLPLARFALPYAHDLSFHLTRIEGVYEGLLSGQFPVRLNPTALNGYGYIDPVMYPQVFLYIPAFFRLCGMSTLSAYQVFIFMINLATAFSAYHCVLRLSRARPVALVAAAAYTMALYRLINIFTRAALGELLAMVFLPWVILGIYQVFWGDEKEYKTLVAGFTGLISSNILILEISGVLCLIFALVSIQRLGQRTRLLALLKTAGFILLLNLWFIYPFIRVLPTGLNVIIHTPANPGEDAVYPAEMFSTFNKALGLSGNLHVPFTGMPLSVGGILGIGVLLWLYGRFVVKKPYPGEEDGEGGRLDKIGAWCCLFALGALFTASILFPWKVVAQVPVLGKFLSAVQFPWRYLGIATPLLCIVSALGLYRFMGDTCRRKVLVFAAIAALMFAASPYIDHYMQDNSQSASLPNKFASFDINYLGGEEYLRIRTNRLALVERPPVIVSSSDGVSIVNYERRYMNLSFDFRSSPPRDGVFLDAPLYYYPGYEARFNGKTILPLGIGENGVVRFFLPPGALAGHVDLRFKSPASYRWMELISLVTVLYLLAKALVSLYGRFKPEAAVKAQPQKRRKKRIRGE